MNSKNGNARKGFASMSKRKIAEITSKGGQACVAKMGVKHMARIGRIGGSRAKKPDAAAVSSSLGRRG